MPAFTTKVFSAAKAQRARVAIGVILDRAGPVPATPGQPENPPRPPGPATDAEVSDWLDKKLIDKTLEVEREVRRAADADVPM